MSEPGEHRYLSTRLVVWRDQRWLALVPALLGLSACAVGAAAELAHPMLDASAWAHQLVTLGSLGVAFTGLALLVQRIGAAKPHLGTVRVRPPYVEIDRIMSGVHRAQRLELPKKRQGFMRVAGEGIDVSLVLRDGRVLVIAVDTPAEATSLLCAAGIDPERRAVQTALSEAGPWTRALRVRRWLRLPAPVHAPALFAAVMAMHATTPTVALGLLAFVAAVAAVLVADAMARVVDQPRVTVGSEGVLVEGFFHRRFIATSRIARADADGRGVALTLDDGGVVVLPIAVGADAAYLNDPAAQDARRSALMELLRSAVRRHGELAPPSSIAVFERQGRRVRDWAHSAREALGRDYRSASYTPDALVELVAAGRATREQRIGAALALAKHPDPTIRERLRLAIDTCADTHLEAALEAAALAELDDDKLDRALATAAAE